MSSSPVVEILEAVILGTGFNDQLRYGSYPCSQIRRPNDLMEIQYGSPYVRCKETISRDIHMKWGFHFDRYLRRVYIGFFGYIGDTYIYIYI